MSLTGRLPVGAGVGMVVEGERKAESQHGRSRSDDVRNGPLPCQKLSLEPYFLATPATLIEKGGKSAVSTKKTYAVLLLTRLRNP